MVSRREMSRVMLLTMPIMARCPHCGHVFPTQLIQAPKETFTSSTIELNEEECPNCHQIGTYGKTAGPYFWRDAADVPDPAEPPPPTIDESQMARHEISA